MKYEMSNEAANEVNGGVVVKMMPKHKTFGKSVRYIAKDDNGSDFEIPCTSLEAAQTAARKFHMSTEVVEVRY